MPAAGKSLLWNGENAVRPRKRGKQPTWLVEFRWILHQRCNFFFPSLSPFLFFFYFNEDQTWLRLLRVSKNVVSDTFFFLSVDSLNVTTVLHATSKKRCRIHYIRKYYFRRKRIKENIENQKTEFRLWEESFEINV